MNLEFIIDFELLNYNLRYNVDEDEFYVLKDGEWKLKKFTNNRGYLRTGFRFEKNKRTHILKHRLVYLAYNPDFDLLKRSRTENMIDHIDRNKLNNRIENLRLVTHQENQFNRNTKGYTFHKQNKKWQADIRINGKKKYLGLFETEEGAHQAYLDAKKIYHVFQSN